MYARTKEKLRIDNDLFPSDLNARSFGIKGTEGVCYRILNTTTDKIDGTESLNSVQNRATIRKGAAVTNPKSIDLVDPETAITWDSPTTGTLIPAQESNPPILLTTANLDIISGAVPHQLTHKFFAHLSYIAEDCCWEPQFGIGGEIEIDGRESLVSALNQWGFWVKFGATF